MEMWWCRTILLRSWRSVFPDFFDKIAVDAPCSGEGMFRKEEEALAQWSEELIHQCARRQLDILRAAASMLRPGGRLVYSTCTFAPEENEGTLAAFLGEHPDFCLEEREGAPGFVPARPEWAQYGREVHRFRRRVGEPSAWSGPFRLMPHRLSGEGHFYCIPAQKDCGWSGRQPAGTDGPPPRPRPAGESAPLSGQEEEKGALEFL